MGGTLTEVYKLTADDLIKAWEVFKQFHDKDWSFTDCTSFVVIEYFRVQQAFAFDRHLKQFGTVQVVP